MLLYEADTSFHEQMLDLQYQVRVFSITFA